MMNPSTQNKRNLTLAALLTLAFSQAAMSENQAESQAESQAQEAIVKPEVPITDTLPQSSAIMQCMVPADEIAVMMQVDLSNDVSNDFVTFTLMEPSETTVLYNQVDKGKVTESIQAGSLSMLLLTEEVTSENGVIKNVGMLNLSKDENGAYSGFLFGKGNLYPLVCVSLLPKPDDKSKDKKEEVAPSNKDKSTEPPAMVPIESRLLNSLPNSIKAKLPGFSLPKK